MPTLRRVPAAGPLVIMPLRGPDHADLPERVSILLAPRGDHPLPCLIFVPETAEDFGQLPESLGEGLALTLATHGSPLDPGSLLVLPVGRQFVIDRGRLELRPPAQTTPGARLERLLASLGSRAGETVLVMPTEGSEPCEACLTAFRAEGGRVIEAARLREEGLPGRPPAAPSAPVPAIRPTTLAHEVRQPLQTLVLLHSLLKRQIEDPRQLAIVERMGETLAQLNAILAAPPPAGQRSLLLQPEDGVEEGPIAPEGGIPLVHVIDDDAAIREAVREVLEAEGSLVRDYGHCEQFLEDYAGETQGCLLVDAYLPGMSGLDLLQEMGRRGHPIPTIVMTGSSDVQMAVSAMKMGASDFLEKPVTAPALIACVRSALARARSADADHLNREKAMQALKGLTRRQRQIMTMVLDGHPSKNIAADLGISQRTVENHRAAIMRRTGSRSLPQLARLILALPTLEIE